MILIVEDNEVHRGAEEVLLRDRGFAVRSCAGAAEALALIRQRPPAVLVLDLAMPGICGEALLEALAADEAAGVGRPFASGMKVIVTTAMADPLPALIVAPVAVLRKPFGIDELADAIRAALGGAAPAQAAARA